MDMEKSNLDWINEAEADVEEAHRGHHHQGLLLHLSEEEKNISFRLKHDMKYELRVSSGKKGGLELNNNKRDQSFNIIGISFVFDFKWVSVFSERSLKAKHSGVFRDCDSERSE